MTEPTREAYAALERELAAARAEQAAMTDILQAMNASPGDVQPVFKVITDRARTLCGAQGVVAARLEGDVLHLVALSTDEAAIAHMSTTAAHTLYPRPLNRSALNARAILSRAPAQIVDVATAPDYDDKLKRSVLAGGIRSLLALPLLRGSHALGSLLVMRAEPGAFDPVLVTALQGFAAQAAIALENARLFGETREALERQTATAEVLEIINSSPTDLQPVFDAIALRAMNLCDANTGMISLVEDGMLHIRALHGVSAEVIALVRNAFPRPLDRTSTATRAICDRKAVQISDVLADYELSPALHDVARKGGPRSGLAVPLLHGKEAIGAIFVSRTAPGLFPPRAVELLQTFASQAVIALQNTRLFQETREALERQTATAEVLDVISSSVADTQPVFQKILDSCQQLIPYESAGLLVIDDEQRIDVAAFRGMSEETARAPFPCPLSETPTVIAIDERRVLHYPDVAADAPPQVRSRLKAIGNHSVALAPMIWEGRGIGSIGLIRVPPKPFSDKELGLLKTFADQAAIAIENARLFNETREALERQTATSEVLEVISSSPTDVQPVFETILDRSIALCQARMGTVLRYDGELLHVAAVRGFSPEFEAAYRAMYPHTADGPAFMDRAVREKQLVHCANVLEIPGYPLAQIIERAGVRNLIAVPMMSGGQCIGVIGMSRAEVGLFHEHQVQLLQTFAAQAVIAIENTRLFNETQQALEQQTAIADILRITTESPNTVEPVLDTVAAHAVRLCDAASASIFLIENGSFRHVVSSGQLADQMRDTQPLEIDRTSVAGRAVLERRLLQIADMQAEDMEFPRGAALARDLGHRSIVCAPLLREGESFGTLLLRRLEVRPFSEREATLVRTFADQAAIAIQSVRLFRETQEALERQTVTSEVLAAIGSSVEDTAPVFEKILDSCERLVDAEQFGIAVVKDDMMHAVAWRGVAPAVLSSIYPYPAHEVSYDPTRSSPFARHLPDTRKAGMLHPVQQRWRELVGDYSAAVAPMLLNGRPVGFISAGRMPPRPFDDTELSVLQTFANQAVIAIENARLFRETREALEQQTATAEVLKVISSSMDDTAPVFERILDSCEELYATDQIGIMLVEGEMVALAAVRGPYGDMIRDLYPTPIAGTVQERMAATKQPVHIPDLSTMENLPLILGRVRERVGNLSFVAAPMVLNDRVVGSIITLRAPPKPFSAKEIALLQTFADQAVVAIENARLFRETHEALQRLTATAEVLRVISQSVADTDPVFEKILDSCEQLFESEEVGILIVQDDGQLHVAGYRGPSRAAVEAAHPRPKEESATWRAIETGTAIYFPDTATATDLPLSLRAIRDLIGDFSSVTAPMMLEGRGVGSIVAIHNPPRPFTDKDIALLETFADQAVIAIENSRLFHEIEEKSRQLAAANQHKSEFLANMSHELRTPLNAVIGFSEVLLDRMFGEINDKQEDYLKDILTSGKHLLSLINDILDLSKIEAGRMELEIEDFDVEAALGNALTLVRERAERHGLTLVQDFSPELGAFRGDQRKFKQIMLNLLSNAVKFTPDGGRITVRARFVDDLLEVAVGDTGIGIAEDDQEAIFQEFRQAGGRYTNKQEGTGLGLTLTRRFVELHGGTIRVESSPGAGATFTFTLPRQP